MLQERSNLINCACFTIIRDLYKLAINSEKRTAVLISLIGQMKGFLNSGIDYQFTLEEREELDELETKLINEHNDDIKDLILLKKEIRHQKMFICLLLTVIFGSKLVSMMCIFFGQEAPNWINQTFGWPGMFAGLLFTIFYAVAYDDDVAIPTEEDVEKCENCKIFNKLFFHVSKQDKEKISFKDGITQKLFVLNVLAGDDHGFANRIKLERRRTNVIMCLVFLILLRYSCDRIYSSFTYLIEVPNNVTDEPIDLAVHTLVAYLIVLVISAFVYRSQ